MTLTLRADRTIAILSSACFLLLAFWHFYLRLDIHGATETESAIVCEWAGSHRVLVTFATVPQ